MHYLGNSNLDFERLVGSLAVPMMILDRDLKFTMVNDPYCKAVDREPDDLLGVPIFDAFPDDPARIEKVRTKFMQALGGETSYLEEQPFLLRDAQGNINERIWRIFQFPYADNDGNITHMIQRCEDVTERVALRQQNEVISAELDHRVRNMLSVVEAMAMLAGSTAEDVDSFIESFSGRLVSMSRSFTQISKSNWQGLSLKSILESELSQFIGADDERLSISGPMITLSVKSTKDTSLMVHELATNAAKYGCFSTSSGKLDITWTMNEDGLSVAWSETGLSGIKPPVREGFGTQLLSMMPNLEVKRTYRDEGLLVEFFVPAGEHLSDMVTQAN